MLWTRVRTASLIVTIVTFLTIAANCLICMITFQDKEHSDYRIHIGIFWACSAILGVVVIDVGYKVFLMDQFNTLLGLEIFLMFLCNLVGTMAIVTTINIVHYEIVCTLSFVTMGLLFMLIIFISIVYGYRRTMENHVIKKLYLPKVHIDKDCHRIDLKKPIYEGRFRIGGRDYYIDPTTGSRFALYRQFSDIDTKRSFDASYPSTSGTPNRVDCIRCGCHPKIEEEKELKKYNDDA